MMYSDETRETIDVLNELLDLESQSVLPRLREAGANVTWSSSDQRHAIDRMIVEESEHRDWLVVAIRDLGGDPYPVWADIRSMDMHYLNLDYMLPRILRDRRELVGYYESAAGRCGSNARAADVISRILERVRRHITQLEKFSARAPA